MRKTLFRFLVFFVASGLSIGAAFGETVLVSTVGKPYASVEQRIEAFGGKVTYRFKNADGLVAMVPEANLDFVKKIPGVKNVLRDVVIASPKPIEAADLSSQVAADLGSEIIPENYFPYTSELTDSRPLQAAGILGQGVIVGIIDSGVSRTATALCSGPCATGTRVIGGESFVPDEPDATASDNAPHGTWVACMVGANGAFAFARTSSLATAVRTYCPLCSFQISDTTDVIPMVGQASASRFFALKVFPRSGAGSPQSRILEAMDRAVELKNTTLPDMKVVNMSLGGPTLFAGGGIEDQLASSMAKSGITLVASAGNAGPSGLTVSSPGTAREILTVGAASSPVHERILRDVQFGTGIGALYRLDNNQQMADFSSRGPDADGRVGPEVVANGFASYVQGANPAQISLASGTSFAAPTISGIAALLYSHKPTATPSEIRSALLLSARPNLIPTATLVEQGRGYVDAAAAEALLDKGVDPVADEGPATMSVSRNILEGAGIETIESSPFTLHLENLRPAERRDFYFLVREKTGAVSIALRNVTPALPPEQQNPLFGDDLEFAVHSAKTSAFGQAGDYLIAPTFVASNREFLLNRPETGLVRVTVLGDSSNAGKISTDLFISEVGVPLAEPNFRGNISEGESQFHTINIPRTSAVTFRLSWSKDWGAFPTNDLDLFVVSPSGQRFSAATLNSPEVLTINNPQPGTWRIEVNGFTVFGDPGKYEVRVSF